MVASERDRRAGRQATTDARSGCCRPASPEAPAGALDRSRSTCSNDCRLASDRQDRARDAEVSAAQAAAADKILGAVGTVIWLDDEALLDAVTALSGSGPAYIFYFIEAMQAVARELGFDEAQARALTLNTFAGAAQLAMQSSESAAALREKVTSKGGTTAAALASFEHDKVDEAIARAIRAAAARARELGS